MRNRNAGMRMNWAWGLMGLLGFLGLLMNEPVYYAFFAFFLFVFEPFIRGRMNRR